MSRRWNLSGLNSLVSRFLPKFEPAGQDDCGCREDQEHGVEDPLTNHANSSVFSLTATRNVFITSAETSRDKTAGANVGPADDRSTLGLFRVGRITERTDRWRPLWVRHTFVARQGWIPWARPTMPSAKRPCHRCAVRARYSIQRFTRGCLGPFARPYSSAYVRAN